jgi:hypothetical protein
MNWKLFSKLVGNWVLFSLYISALWVIAGWVMFPSMLSRKYTNFISAMTSVAAQTPPYSWLGLTPEQTMGIALGIDLLNIMAILTWPKLSGVLALMALGNRQFFLRYNEDNPALPNSPLCGYRAPHCGNMDLWHLAFAICAVLVYNSEHALPELTVKFVRSLGYEPPRWVSRWTSKFRAIVPERRVEKPVAAESQPSEAARKNI